MRIHNLTIACLSFLSAALAGCATQSTIDRLEAEIGNPTAPNNLVAKGGTRERPEFTTGGFLSGTRPYAVKSWKEVVSTEFAGGKVTLLAGDGEQIPLGRIFSEEDTAAHEGWGKIVASRFAAMAEILGGQIPRIEIKFRLVPSGVKYRFAEKQSFTSFDTISLDLLAVIPPRGELDRDWVLTQAITAVHESFHVIRKDPKRFPREAEPAEEETQAYVVGMCSSVIASKQVPSTLFAFPKGLEDAVDPDERDILIRDVYKQSLELKNHPTVVGLNVAMLGFFRYLTQLQSNGIPSPGATESLPFCRATARDELHWAEAGIDSQIMRLAEQVAKFPR